jgi:hypothetical protein
VFVGSRDCSKLVEGVLKQIDVVRDQLGGDVPVHGVLCFVEADWPLLGGSFTTQGVRALWPKKLFPCLKAEGPLTAETIGTIHTDGSHTRCLPPETTQRPSRRYDCARFAAVD